MPRYNYTDRKRILRSDVPVELNEVGVTVVPEIVLHLSDYEFPQDAEIWFEFYTNSFLKRYQYGTIGKPGRNGPKGIIGSPIGKPGRNGPKGIIGSPKASELKVRLKVLDPDADSSRILGVMKGVKPGLKDEDSDKRNQSIIDLRPDNLGGEVWRLDVKQDRNDYPILYLEEKLGDIVGVALSTSFQSLVMPKVMQEILVNIIIFSAYRDDEDDSIWGDWLRLAQNHSPGSKTIPVVDHEDNDWGTQVEDAMIWIVDVIGSWAKANHYGEQYVQLFKGEVK